MNRQRKNFDLSWQIVLADVHKIRYLILSAGRKFYLQIIVNFGEKLDCTL